MPAHGWVHFGRARRRSPLGHASASHAFALTFACGKEIRIVAPCVTGTVTTNTKHWIECKSCLSCHPRLFYRPEPREHSRELEVRHGEIPVCLKTSTQPGNCFRVGVKSHLGEPDP